MAQLKTLKLVPEVLSVSQVLDLVKKEPDVTTATNLLYSIYQLPPGKKIGIVYDSDLKSNKPTIYLIDEEGTFLNITLSRDYIGVLIEIFKAVYPTSRTDSPQILWGIFSQKEENIGIHHPVKDLPTSFTIITFQSHIGHFMYPEVVYSQCLPTLVQRAKNNNIFFLRDFERIQIDLKSFERDTKIKQFMAEDKISKRLKGESLAEGYQLVGIPEAPFLFQRLYTWFTMKSVNWE